LVVVVSETRAPEFPALLVEAAELPWMA